VSGSDGAGPGWAALGSATALEGALRQVQQERFTGRLIALGAAGVEIWLDGGLVTAMVTPAAPGPDSLLLKSGRVNQSDWAKALDAVGDSGRLDEVLIARSLVGGGELDVIRAAALFDGMFAVFLDAPESWEAQSAVFVSGAAAGGGPDSAAGSGGGLDASLPLFPGVPPALLLAEAGRRCTQLARRWGSPAHVARVRPLATAKAARTSAGVIQRHQEILLCANGRRTPRDIAFVLGRGVYAVMIDIGQLDKRGLVQTTEQVLPATLPSVAPRRIEPGAAAPVVLLPQRLPQRVPRPAAQAEGMTPYPSFDRTQPDRLKWRMHDHADPDAAGEPPHEGAR
jgi:hypothetical protein